MKSPGAPFSLEVLSTSVIKPRAAGGSNGKSNGKSGGGGSNVDVTPLSVVDATIGTSNWTGLPAGVPGCQQPLLRQCLQLAAAFNARRCVRRHRCCAVATSIGRAISFPTQLDPKALAAALQHTVDDLPFLAGRFGGLKKLRLDSLAIRHTGEGVPFTVARAEGELLRVAGLHCLSHGTRLRQPASQHVPPLLTPGRAPQQARPWRCLRRSTGRAAG